MTLPFNFLIILKKKRMEIKDKAITCFRNGYNCAQAVALVFNIEENGAVRAASAFGGGMGRMQQT